MARSAPAVLAAGFDPAEHPRDRAGKFTRTGRAAPGGGPVRVFPPAARPAGVRMGNPKECIGNTARTAMEHPGLGYAEGVAQTPKVKGLWFRHAWNVTADGRAVDTTWDPPGTRYLGRTWPVADVIAESLRRGAYDYMDRAAPEPPDGAPVLGAFAERDHPRRPGGEHGGGEFTRTPGAAPGIRQVGAGLASTVEVEPGCDPAAVQRIADALTRLPPAVTANLRSHLAMLSVAPRLYYGSNDHVLGQYLAGLDVLLVAARTDVGGDLETAVVHEALHGYDANARHPTFEKSGSPEWRAVAKEIRAAGIPMEKAYTLDPPVGDQEMFAELGARFILGKPLTLDRETGTPLPVSVLGKARLTLMRLLGTEGEFDPETAQALGDAEEAAYKSLVDGYRDKARLTSGERGGARAYMTRGAEINAALRRGETTDPAVAGLDSAMAKYRLPAEVTGTRTVQAGDWLPAGNLAGKTMPADPGYLSLALTGRHVAPGRVELTLTVPAGQHALVMEGALDWSPEKAERELVLPRGLAPVIDTDVTDATGWRHITGHLPKG